MCVVCVTTQKVNLHLVLLGCRLRLQRSQRSCGRWGTQGQFRCVLCVLPVYRSSPWLSCPLEAHKSIPSPLSIVADGELQDAKFRPSSRNHGLAGTQVSCSCVACSFAPATSLSLLKPLCMSRPRPAVRHRALLAAGMTRRLTSPSQSRRNRLE